MNGSSGNPGTETRQRPEAPASEVVVIEAEEPTIDFDDVTPDASGGTVDDVAYGAAAASFRQAVRGYRRGEVDAFVESAARRVDELERMVERLRDEVAAAGQRPSLGDLDDNDLLEIASDETAQLIRLAKSRAQEIRDAGGRDAEGVRAAADAYHAEMVTEGDRLRAEAAQTLDNARDDASAVQSDAKEVARTIIDEAQKEAEAKADTLLTDAQGKADTLVSDARERLDRASAEADTLLTDAQGKADGLISDAEQRLADATDKAARVVTEAEQRASSIVSAADEQAATTSRQASVEAEGTISEAYAAAQQLREEAAADARRVADEAAAHYDRVVSDAEDRYEEIRAALEAQRMRMRDELTNQREELRRTVESMNSLRQDFSNAFHAVSQSMDQVVGRLGEPVQRAEEYVAEACSLLAEERLPELEHRPSAVYEPSDDSEAR